MKQKKKKRPKMRWRILSCILALCMILTAVPTIPLWAAEERAGNATITEEQTIETEKGTPEVRENIMGSEVTNKIKENLTENQAKSGVNDEDISDRLKDFSEETEKQEIDSAKNEGSNPDEDVTPGQRATAAAKPMSGTCGKSGDDVRWRLEPANNYYKLVISGKGKMADYDYNPMSDDGDLSGYCTNQPWFWKHNEINAVVIEKGVTYIGTGAFCDLGNVREGVDVVIPDSVNTISDGAFAVSIIANITIPSSIDYIGKEAFSWIDFPWGDPGSKPTITIAEGISYIGDKAFSCSDFSNISIPNSVTHIGEGAFQDCLYLRSATLSNSVTSIEPYTFAGCEALSNIVIPDGVTRIGAHAFDNCWSLKKVTIPVSVTNIGYHTFYDCDELTDVYYSRSKEIWDAIDIENGNEPLTDAEIHYNDDVDNSNTDITEHTVTFHSKLGNTDTVLNLMWGWDLFNQPSSMCYGKLAVAGLALSNTAEYRQENVESMLKKLEFDTKEPYSINYDKKFYEITQPGVTFGYKENKDDKGQSQYIFAIVLRGTSNWADTLTDASSIFGGFSLAAEFTYTTLKSYILKCGLRPDDIKGKVNFFITGHSLGGAVANLVAKRLNDDYGAKSVFAYTFATPRSMTRLDTSAENIFNILNIEDEVPVILSTQTERYGQDIWFHRHGYGPRIYEHFKTLTNGLDLKSEMETLWLLEWYVDHTPFIGSMFNYAHAPETYMAYLLSIVDPSEASVMAPAARFCCPVDVEVYTSKGLLVGRVTDNKVDDTVSGTYIHVENDEKTIYLLYEGEYTFKITGTGNGTMEYSVGMMDLTTGELSKGTEKIFKNVKLTPGKEMNSKIKTKDNAISTNISDGTSDIQLLVLDDKGKAQKKVLSDGKEVPLKTPNITVKKIKIAGSSKKIAVGKKLKLKVAVSPSNATNKAVTWKSSNTKYVTVNSKGIVTIKKAAGGKIATITAIAKDGSGIKASYKIQCMKGAVKKVTISGKKTRTIKAGKFIKLKAKVKATKGANKTLKWSSRNTKYAKVNSKGKVITKKAGKGKTVKITAAATDGSGKKAVVKIKLK